MTHLFTFLMDYLGGTYISQVECENKEQAMKLWIQSLQIDQIEGFSERDKENIISVGFLEDDPTKLDGLCNVWHFIIETKEGDGFVNFVKTIKN
ncbi:hypothetical protein [Mucilaginibacter gotjawali]|uniref:Uncharacterized protein n=2 Tax=Mucilaginibacter gotjawali TaxID=1550579 RepID=A0A110B1N5_9SPHI|nr:hypothetical protein [Mucilaginibacter gotjawali]MBB3057190.1 hypothetical protein [Mucilaginibacter gotjawali]BAU53043.1 hypothetical protein MgSA37_01210 [Mucilaginibacter gotjawali]